MATIIIQTKILNLKAIYIQKITHFLILTAIILRCKKRFYLRYEKKLPLTTEEKIILSEQNDCTFKPKINNFKSVLYNPNKEDTFNRLYKVI